MSGIQEIERLQREIRETKQVKEELEHDIKAKKRVMRELGDTNKKEVEEFKKEMENLDRNKEGLENKLNELTKEIKLRGIIYSKEKTIEKNRKEIKKLQRQTKEIKGCKKEIEDLKRKRDEFENEIVQLKQEIHELKEKLVERDAQVNQLESDIKKNNENHQKDINDMKNKYQKDIDKVKGSNAKNIEDMVKRHENEIKKLDEFRKAYDWVEEEAKKLKEEKISLKKDLKEKKKLVRFHNENSNMLYMAEICCDLQTNVYHYVMPKNYCPKGCWSHKIKDIYKDIDDEEIDDDEREEAKIRWEELKKKDNWKKLQNLLGPMGILKRQRLIVAHPQNLDKEEAKRIAQELHGQGKLKGKTSIENITQIIDLWSVSKSCCW